MSYGAPWERGVDAANTMPLRDLEVPGLVPDADGVELNTKEAQWHLYQRGRRQQRQEEKSSLKTRSREDHDIAAWECLRPEEVAMHRQELRVICEDGDQIASASWQLYQLNFDAYPDL